MDIEGKDGLLFLVLKDGKILRRQSWHMAPVRVLYHNINQNPANHLLEYESL